MTLSLIVWPVILESNAMTEDSEHLQFLVPRDTIAPHLTNNFPATLDSTVLKDQQAKLDVLTEATKISQIRDLALIVQRDLSASMI